MAFPAEEKIGEIRAALARNASVVFCAPPGSGKTTCIPPALIGEKWLEGRKIVMLEPRRLAARNCAAYMAGRMGEKPGGTVGYSVRLERKVSAATRLEVVTEGLLAQRMLADPELSDTGLLVFDEFHERSLQCDLAFAFALEVRKALRPDLRILVMSATLDPGPVAGRLGDAVTIEASGRMHPVETRYLGGVSVAAAVSRAVAETDGDILCFLPGEGEIRRAVEAASSIPGCVAVPLYGSLPKEEQDAAFAPSRLRKIVFATSIAETSLTIPGITCVIDCGLMRIPRFSPATGMSGLVTVPLSLDRADQRSGRAGRLAPGVCYRLWNESENAFRPARMTPEILDADLASVVLSCASWGAVRREDLPWMTPPPAASWERASSLLVSLGAVGGDGRITEKGAAMARLPMHPRLASMLLGAGAMSGVAARLCAILEERPRLADSDVRRPLDETAENPSSPFARRVARLSARFLSAVRAAPPSAFAAPAPRSEGALLALAYPDRVARNRGDGTFRMVCGRGAALDRSDSLAKSRFVVCCELDGRQGDSKIFAACPVEREELEEIFAGSIVSETRCEWDGREERVAASVRRMLGAMVLSEAPARLDGTMRSEALDALLRGVRQKGVANLPCWTKESLQTRARIAFLRRRLGDAWPEPDDAAIVSALAGFADGMTRWRDLEKIDMDLVLDETLRAAGRDRRELDRLAPVRIEVPSGSRMFVRYDGDEPTVEVRLQECFGMMESPRVAGGVPVVMTLLSPAHRPVQITKDLAGFWKEGYALVRKDMRGRYPKHYWPEDPFTAVATRRTRPGGKGT